MGKWMLVSPEKMEVFSYEDLPSVEQAQKIVDKGKARDKPFLILEKTGAGKYFLVFGFTIYPALKKLAPHARVLCLVKRAQPERERLLWIVKYTFPREDLPWILKNRVITHLTEKYYLTPERIAKATGMHPTLIKEYLFNTRIPAHIRTQAKDKKTLEIIETIRRSLEIPPEMKPVLYERAILPKGHVRCLDEKKMFLMQQFCSHCHIPEHLLAKLNLLEKLVDELLLTNFKLASHWNRLLTKFIIEHRSKMSEIDAKRFSML